MSDDPLFLPRFLPRFRVTIELVEPDPRGGAQKAGVYAYDTNRIAGDVWLAPHSPRASFDIRSREFIVALGNEAYNCRSVQEFIALERAKK